MKWFILWRKGDTQSKTSDVRIQVCPKSNQNRCMICTSSLSDQWRLWTLKQISRYMRRDESVVDVKSMSIESELEWLEKRQRRKLLFVVDGGGYSGLGQHSIFQEDDESSRRVAAVPSAGNLLLFTTINVLCLLISHVSHDSSEEAQLGGCICRD